MHIRPTGVVIHSMTITQPIQPSPDGVNDRFVIQQELPEAMDHAVKALCDLKLQMDQFAHGAVGQPFLDDWMDARNTCAYTGDALLRLVLPFLAPASYRI